MEPQLLYDSQLEVKHPFFTNIKLTKEFKPFLDENQY